MLALGCRRFSYLPVCSHMTMSDTEKDFRNKARNKITDKGKESFAAVTW